MIDALTTFQFQHSSLLSAYELTISLFPAVLPILQMDSFHKSREGESDTELPHHLQNLQAVFLGAMWGTRQPSLCLPCGQCHYPHSLGQIMQILCPGPQPQHLCHRYHSDEFVKNNNDNNNRQKPQSDNAPLQSPSTEQEELANNDKDTKPKEEPI
ncbi:hypothetical protein NE237_002807 [Protea cynaroides]|uniref:Uncharacterized protein n=1 Tax=Protea cynaroides TaxID=273540 RepID=A0A9Q0KFJ0_9MAGN|nr:hypothetical protein NE237_002807 [Protea cynaroides]